MHSYNIIERGMPITRASKALIALHGRGGTALDILNFAQMVSDDTIYMAAPQATNNSWYPHRFMEEEALNEPWLSSAVEIVKSLIDATGKHIPYTNIILLGFSQGACLALETSVRFADRYGGVIAFSGGLIGATINREKYHGDFEGTPVFIGNSDIDPHIPLSRSEESKIIMETMGANVTFRVYKGMGHTINQDEITWAKKLILEPAQKR